MPRPALPWSRRSFLRNGALLGAGLSLTSHLPAASATRKLFPTLGIAAPLRDAVALKAAGAAYLTEGVDRLLAPDQPEDVFNRNLEALAASPLPVLACNNFIRARHLRCVGSDATHDQVLEWSDTTFRRAQRAGVKYIVFGSSGSRALRDGWTKEQADPQFVALLKRMGGLAAGHGVVVALEQLRREECNYINHVAEGAAIIRAVDHPNIRLLADFYHMVSVDDTPEDLKAALDVVVHLEIAEVQGRSVPGINGQDFRPFFQALREGGYTGSLNIEANWRIEQVAPAFAEINRQANGA